MLGVLCQAAPVFTYLVSYLLMDPQAGLGSVVITDWAVCIVKYLFTEACDQFGLWYIQPRVRVAIPNLYIRVPLAGVANCEEVIGLIDFIWSVNWNEVLIDQGGRREGGTGGLGCSLGKNTELVQDFIHFYPWEYRKINCQEAEGYWVAPRIIPVGHPKGYVDSDEYYRACDEHDPMVDNDPVDLVERNLDEVSRYQEAMGALAGPVAVCQSEALAVHN